MGQNFHIDPSAEFYFSEFEYINYQQKMSW